MRVHLSTPLSAPPEWVAAQLQSSAVFRHITAPLIQFHPARGTEWPTHWAPGELALHMRLLGVLPMGPQTVRISIEPAAQRGGWPTLMTPLSALFAQVFYRHRQRRWRQLAAQHAAGGAAPTALHRCAAFNHLLASFARQPDAPPAQRWRWLEAAHVLGQTSLPLHWRSHTAMLRYALALGDAREATGQLLRLA